jgi:hypothetical protein
MAARGRRVAATIAIGGVAVVLAGGAARAAGAEPAKVLPRSPSVREARIACKARVREREARFDELLVSRRERFRARQEARRAGYVLLAPHTPADNQRFIRMMRRRKLIFHEIQELIRTRFYLRQAARFAACSEIGEDAGPAVSQESVTGAVVGPPASDEAPLYAEPVPVS